ncbi:MAG: hypothetical protein ACLFUP_02405 [Desulfobacteraceae bacterium]
MENGVKDIAFCSFIIESLPIGVLTVSPELRVTRSTGGGRGLQAIPRKRP